MHLLGAPLGPRVQVLKGQCGTGGGRPLSIAMTSGIADINRVRAQLRQQRRALTPQQHQIAGENLLEQLLRLHSFQTSKRIACYLPNDGEIDTGPVISWILQRNRSCYLPVLSHINGNRLLFAPVTHDSDMGLNRFGIPEPVTRFRDLVTAMHLDMVLLPLVGFDALGNRIGMGGGYYDRSLQTLRHRRHWHKPRLFGIAHDLQKLDHIDAQPWDVPLQGVITDRQIYLARKQGDQKS